MKKRVRVTEVTANPPHTHSTNVFPQIGSAERKLVITVAAQKLIWPQGKTYPRKAVPIVRANIKTPQYHVALSIYDA